MVYHCAKRLDQIRHQISKHRDSAYFIAQAAKTMHLRVFPESQPERVSSATFKHGFARLRDGLDELKADAMKHILAAAYGVGLGYTTLNASRTQHNMDSFREIVLEAQTAQRQIESPQNLFHYVAKGNLYEVQMRLNDIEESIKKEVRRLIPEDTRRAEYADEVERRINKSSIRASDCAGANIVHLAYLLKHYHIGHYLVKRYPRLASMPYTDDVKSLIDFIKGGTNGNPGHAQLKDKMVHLLKQLNIDPSDFEDEPHGKAKPTDGEHHHDRRRDQEKYAKLRKMMLYTGENILHITIMRRNYEEVRWLLDFYHDHRHSYPDCLSRILNTHATGQFFHRDGSFYVGSNPLQFAVCSNTIAIFDLVYSFVSAVEEKPDDGEWKGGFFGQLVSAGAHHVTAGDGGSNRDTPTRGRSAKSAVTLVHVGPDVIFSTDEFGNNVLHLCVLHGLETMYQHVYETAVHVMRRKIKAVYIEQDKRQDFKDRSTVKKLGPFTLSCTIDDTNACKGYRLQESKLYLPENDKGMRDWAMAQAKVKVNERLVMALNEDLHSPLTLAAANIDKREDSPERLEMKVSMLRFLVENSKQKLWEYGPVTMSILDLEGLEIKYDVLELYNIPAEARSEVMKKPVHSAITWLCLNDSDKAISIPDIQQIIQHKWERLGYPFFILSFLLNTFLTICTTIILVFINATPRSNTFYDTEITANLMYLIVSVIFFIMFCQEVYDVLKFGASLREYRGVALFEKFLRVLKIVAFVVFCCYKAALANNPSYDIDDVSNNTGAVILFHRQYDVGVKLSIVVCVVASYFHLYYYFMGFDTTGPFVLTLFRIISTDVPYFLQFYFINLLATTCALSVLRHDFNNPTANHGFLIFGQAMWTLIQDTVSVEASSDVINDIGGYPSHLQWLADIILTVYYGTVVILMMNLLIAMISNTYGAYCEYSDAILLIAKYNIMGAMEWAMGSKELRDNRAKYTQISVQSQTGEVRSLYPKDTKDTSSKPLTGSQSPRGNSTKGSVKIFAADTPITAVDGPAGLSMRRDGSTLQTPLVSPVGDGVLPRNSTEALDPTAGNATTRYLFELQSVNNDWYGNSAAGGAGANTAAVAGGAVDSAKLAEALATLGVAMPAPAVSAAAGSDATEAAGSSTFKTTLFIIDPQVDFHPGGSLGIPAAVDDSERIAKMIEDFGEEHIHDIFVSMDSHYPCHIAHAVSWHKKDDPNVHPEPFTQITNSDVLTEKWVYADASKEGQEWARKYTSQLERRGRMVLTIWPEHCIIGSHGHSVVPNINAALQKWAEKAGRPVNYIMKGQNLRVEMYSALQAEVHDDLDQNTGMNMELLSMLKTSDKLLICGEAMSHCVNYTTRDIIEHWDRNMSSIVLLTDGASAVKGFEVDAEEFKSHCARRGVTLNTIKQAFSGCKPKQTLRR